MASMATVTVRDFAILDANTPPPMSIWLSSQPPKISPLALVSAGIASVRMQRSPRGSVEDKAACVVASVNCRISRRHCGTKPRTAVGSIRPHHLEHGLGRDLEIVAAPPCPDDRTAGRGLIHALLDQ